jgi:hypothetical protein
MKTVLITLASMFCVSACGGNVDVGGSAALAGGSSGADLPGGGSDGVSSPGVGTGGSTGGSNSPACAVPAGTVATLDTTEKFYAAIVGRWLICAGGPSAFSGVPANVIGVEYDAPNPTPTNEGTILRGNMYDLVDSPDGVVRGAGFDYQGTYDVSPQDPADGPPVQLDMHPAPNSGFGGPFRYSPSPRQWLLGFGSADPGGSALLVPAD